jgi:hypothetical protein
MAYVDLNPIRASMAKSADTSEYTSIYERNYGRSSIEDKADKNGLKFKPVFGFIGDDNQLNKDVKDNHYSLTDYIKLEDWTERFFREDKSGFDDKHWQMLSREFGKKYHRAIGTLVELNSKIKNE